MRTGCEPTRFGNEAKTIIHGDALAELKKIPAESVDLIFADPTYNIGKNFDGLIEAWKEDLFIDWLFEVIAECHRVLKKQGSMYIMNSTENRSSFQASIRPSKFLPMLYVGSAKIRSTLSAGIFLSSASASP
jgi:DNA modification methylase